MGKVLTSFRAQGIDVLVQRLKRDQCATAIAKRDFIETINWRLLGKAAARYCQIRKYRYGDT